VSSQPLDPRRRAFADALGHLLAELAWREVVGADSQNTNEWGDLALKNDETRPRGNGKGRLRQERTNAGIFT
jgi:hypothetical protein